LFAVTSGSGANASGFNLDDHRSANDNRPVYQAGSVYTDSDFGFEVAIGATFSLSKNFYVGPLFDLSGVFIDNGWDRYSSYQIQHTRLVVIPAGGIKFGYRTSKTTAIECNVLAGKNGFGCNAGLVWNL
jgi:hypothetical protein